MSETSDQDQRLRVVVAEDESLIRLDLVEMLDAGGYDVVAAVSDGEAAVAAIAEHRPDLALLDVKMPARMASAPPRRSAPTASPPSSS